MFRQLTKGEVKQIADIMLGEVFKRAEEKEIKIDVTERFKVTLLGYKVLFCMHGCLLFYSAIASFAASTVCFEQGRLCISWALVQCNKHSNNDVNFLGLSVGSSCG